MDSKTITLSVNGKEITAITGRPLLEVLRAEGIEMPTLCYHPALQPYGACRLCLVEIWQKNGSKVAASCSTPVSAGMIVHTESELAMRARRSSMQMILARCSGVKSLWDFAARLGVTDTPYECGDEDCIQCGLCERVCRELIGASVISFAGRGAEREVKVPFEKSSEVCIGCEACVTVCPTGKVRSVLEDSHLVMTTWNTALDLARCTGCGGLYTPEQMLRRLAPIAEKKDLEIALCPTCRRRALAARYYSATRSLAATAAASSKTSFNKSED